MANVRKRPRSYYTIASSPPVQVKKVTVSTWAQLFEECRSFPGEWRRKKEPMKKSTASQMASDIRNAGRRTAPGRLKGIRSGERWETVYNRDPTDPDPSHYYIWIKYVGAPEA